MFRFSPPLPLTFKPPHFSLKLSGVVLTLCAVLLLLQGFAYANHFPDGTVVSLTGPDLVPVYSQAEVEAQQLIFPSTLEPETEVRVLIISPGSETAVTPPYGRISPSGDDIYVQFEGATQAVSLKRWLADEYGVELIFAPPEGTP